MSTISIEAKTVAALQAAVKSIKHPDERHNVGHTLGELHIWSVIKKLAETKVEDLYKTLQTEGHCDLAEVASRAAGNYEIVTSPKFALVVEVTQPVKRFDVNALSQALLKSKYKVPEHTTKELAEAAKVPTKGQVRKKVVER